MLRFFQAVRAAHASAPAVDAPYAEWHSWSCEHPEKFWGAVWRFTGIISDEGAGRDPWDTVVDGFARMAPPDAALGPRWFRGARLNFAENLLRRRGAAPAIVFRDERGGRREVTHDALAADVARVAGGLRAIGIRPGDRVAGFLPNIPETVIAMLASAACGAVWSSCSPDFGAAGVLDRFGQIGAACALCRGWIPLRGYMEIDSLGRVREIVHAIPSIECVVVIPLLRAARGDDLSTISNAESWQSFAARGAGAPLRYERLPFDHPLYVMYSSGTTGLPNALIHGAGGTLIQHLKEHQLHTAIGPDDRVFYFTTCGWMMWGGS